MYNSLSIENFRGIQKLEMKDFQRINLLTGKNNSGKTSVLEALYLLSQSENSRAVMQCGAYRKFSKVEENFWLSFLYDIENFSKIEGAYNNEKRTVQIKSLQAYKDLNQILSDFYMAQTNSRYNGLELTYKSFQDNNHYSSEVSIYKEGEQLREKNISQAPVKEIPSILAIYPDYQDTIRRFSALELEKRTDVVVNVLKQIEPSIQYIRYISIDDTFYCDVDKERLIPLNIMGDGVVRLFSIVLAIATTKKGGVVLLDEIDTGFHYSSLEVLWKAVYDAAEKFDVQVFATTHSYECLRSLAEFHKQLSETEKKDDVRLYRIEKGEEQHRVVPYSSEIFETAVEHYSEVR